MELIFLVIISIIIIAGFMSVIFIFRNMRAAMMSKKDKEESSFVFLQNQINEVTRVLDSKLGESTKMMQRQFGESARIIRDVTDRLTKLDSTNQQVVNFAGQLENLQNILKNPKHRGILGEYFLETVLSNTLPDFGREKRRRTEKNGRRFAR